MTDRSAYTEIEYWRLSPDGYRETRKTVEGLTPGNRYERRTRVVSFWNTTHVFTYTGDLPNDLSAAEEDADLEALDYNSSVDQ